MPDVKTIRDQSAKTTTNGEPGSPAVEAVPPVDPPKVPAVPKSSDAAYTVKARDGFDLEFCAADARPPGAIADQDTLATGVWVRIPGMEWHKTDMSEARAFGLVRRSKTAPEAYAFLIATA